MDYLQVGLIILLGLLSSAVITALLIPVLRRLKTGQNIREEGPKSHQVKSGTPTMGGLAIIAAVTLICITTQPFSKEITMVLVVFILFGALGFLDDYLKVVKKHNLGLRAWQKLIVQIAIGVGLALYHSQSSYYGTTVHIPFADVYWDFGIWYVPFIAFVIVAMANSVNLTDGLDGLAAGVTSMVALFFAIAGLTFSLNEGTAFSSALAGACLGFLIFNRNPAKVFMGDTGSLALGGGLAAAAIVMNMELILPVVGFVYVAEALSVIIQVIGYKTTRKRVFKMAPLHHHFELSGFTEKQVVVLFWIATLIFCVIGLKIL